MCLEGEVVWVALYMHFYWGLHLTQTLLSLCSFQLQELPNLDIKTINLCCNLVLMSSIWCCGTTVLDNDVCVSLISSSSPAIVYSRSPEPRK